MGQDFAGYGRLSVSVAEGTERRDKERVNVYERQEIVYEASGC